MQKIAGDLVRAQKSGDLMKEARLLKQWADEYNPIRRVNAATVQPMPDRFLSKLIFGASECWVWRGHVDAIGYGRFPYQGENKAHRVAYRYFNGEIPDGLLVLHKCDNRQCVNPGHLFLGTQAENMADMTAKGRGYAPRRFGEQNPMAKLTASKVQEIRRMVAAGAKQVEASAKYGVSPMTVSRIIRKELWA